MKIAMIQMPVGYDKEQNIQIACEKIREASAMSIDMAVLPEMFCCPYSSKYFGKYSEEEGGPAQKALSALAKELGIHIIGGSLPERSGEQLYNTSYVYNDKGDQIAKSRKIHLFDIDVKGGQRFMESETLTAGNDFTTFDTPFGRFGLCICFDFRFCETSALLCQKGALAIFVPAAFNMTTGPAHWELLFRQRAVDYQLFTVGVAPARNPDSEYVSYGNSIAVSPWGDVIARCGGNECTLIVNLDLSQVEDIRAQLPLLSARRTDLYLLEEKV